jgi:demethylmenaquinone methyltransferase / 2-methoxy-6-polyprenyl-1,4-benzoquinol methylase
MRRANHLKLPEAARSNQPHWLDSTHALGHFSRMPVSELETAEAQAAAAGGDAKRAYVQRIFSQIAPTYDFLNHLLSFNIDKGWRRKAIAALGWERAPSGTYVDLCAGTLDVSAMLAQRPAFAGRVLGADFAEPMLRAGFAKVQPERVTPVVADALDLPLPDDSAAGAIVAFGIRNVADLDAGLREVRRVLAPGARFVILEFTTPRSAVVRGLYHLYFHHLAPLIGALVSGHRTAYTYLPRSVANFPIEEQLASRMRDAGFAAVEWRTLTLGVAAIHVGTKT